MKLILKESKMLFHRMIYFKNKFVPEISVLGYRFAHTKLVRMHNIVNESMVEMNQNLCEYPQILDTSEEGQRRHFRSLWYDSIKALPSVEEKLHELSIQQKKDLKKYSLSSVPPTFNGINFHKYITRTHFVNSLPQMFLDMNVESELGEIRETLCETLLNYYCNAWRENKSKELRDFLVEPNAGSHLASSLILQCYKKLALRNDYIINSTIQQKPRIFSFWWHDGFGSEEDEIDVRNLCFQYEDHGAFAIRGKHPILPILDRNDDLCSSAEVSDYHFHPDVFQIPAVEIPRIASIPGYWPGDPHQYPFLLVLTSDKFKSLTSQLEFYDEIKIDEGAAIISSFAWLNAVATYQGFTPFHDLTYPLVTHTIVTNGQDWNFFTYQLNTIAFHSDVDKKDRRNLCWSSGRLRLFDTVEDGIVKGINDGVFQVLLKFLHNTPQVREGLDMQPYLGDDMRSPIEQAHLRLLLRKHYSRVVHCNWVKNFSHVDEVPMWVKIYKLHPDAPPSPFIKLQ